MVEDIAKGRESGDASVTELQGRSKPTPTGQKATPTRRDEVPQNRRRLFLRRTQLRWQEKQAKPK